LGATAERQARSVTAIQRRRHSNLSGPEGPVWYAALAGNWFWLEPVAVGWAALGRPDFGTLCRRQ